MSIFDDNYSGIIWRKGYAMESDVVENDLDKGDKQLFHYLELRHTYRRIMSVYSAKVYSIMLL